MQYLTLPQCKHHLRLEENWDLDDWAIMTMAEAAEDALARALDCPLVQYENECGELPAALQQAALLILGDFYNSRESDSSIQYRTTQAFERLIALYHDYGIRKKGC